jgi:hypothetical protein
MEAFLETQPTTILCLVKKRLIAELESVHTRIVSIHNQETESLIRGDPAADASLVGELKTGRNEGTSLFRNSKSRSQITTAEKVVDRKFQSRHWMRGRQC